MSAHRNLNIALILLTSLALGTGHAQDVSNATVHDHAQDRPQSDSAKAPTQQPRKKALDKGSRGAPLSDHAMDHSRMNHSAMSHEAMTRDAAQSSAPGDGGDESETTQSEQEHVAPDPPQHVMGAMPYKAMTGMMQMDDTAQVGKVLVDQFEWLAHSNAAVWDAQAWYGDDYNKVWIKTEGERTPGRTQDARVELTWDRIVARWWSVQAGARHDFGEGPPRTWAAIGVEGLAPYWFDVEATFYVAEAGRTAVRLKAEYDLLFTQRLILQPQAEANLYGRDDRERNLGSGISDLEVGLRLRYEIRREIAPYLGLTWQKRFGRTADFARAAGEDSNDVRIAAGIRFWF
jgi:copper resistance protein B